MNYELKFLPPALKEWEKLGDCIRTNLTAIPTALEARDCNKLRTTLDSLSDLLFYLED